jgi:hypothetical protein
VELDVINSNVVVKINETHLIKLKLKMKIKMKR